MSWLYNTAQTGARTTVHGRNTLAQPPLPPPVRERRLGTAKRTRERQRLVQAMTVAAVAPKEGPVLGLPVPADPVSAALRIAHTTIDGTIECFANALFNLHDAVVRPAEPYVEPLNGKVTGRREAATGAAAPAPPPRPPWTHADAARRCAVPADVMASRPGRSAS